MSITDTARGQVFGSEGGGFLTLVTIIHPILIPSLRFCNNNVNITSNGDDYIAYPFKLTPPDDRDGNVPAAKLVIDNVDRQISQGIRQMTTPPTISIQVIRIDDLDSVEVVLPVFTLRNVEIDALTISGDLIIDDPTKEAFPGRSFTPADWPGLFAV